MPDATDNPQLEETIRQAASGDEAAWHTLVDLYSRRVFGLIRAQCGNVDLAEEITQSTFCTVASKLASYTEQGKFESWLFHIAMNRLRDEMRRRRRHAVSVEPETMAGLVGTDRDAETGGRADSEDLAALRQAMEQLSPADRRIVHLRHHAGLSFKQISDVLGEPLGTVLARQHRALKKLKTLMTEPAAAPEQKQSQ